VKKLGFSCDNCCFQAMEPIFPAVHHDSYSGDFSFGPGANGSYKKEQPFFMNILKKSPKSLKYAK